MRLFRKLGLLFGRSRFRSELDEEMAFHRTQAEKELTAGGMTPAAAHNAAIRQFGNTTRLRERSEEVVGFRFETVVQDLRFCLRQMRKNPGFAITAVLVLTLGIAASVAIFAFVDAALLKPLPFRDPARLMVLYETNVLGGRFHLSYLDYLDWKRINKSFRSLDVYAPYGYMEKTAQGLRPADGARVSAGFFRTLGITPILGRDFYDGEDAAAPAPTVLLSYGAWRKRYGGRTDVLGQTVTLDNQVYSIIGVLPRAFHFAPAEPVDFWGIEKPSRGCESDRGCHNLLGIARLKEGVSFDAAMADIKAIARQLELQYPKDDRERGAFMEPLSERIVGKIKPILLVLLAGAALLLLIAGVNVASLLLVRAQSRRREMAVRGALGAAPRRLARQLTTEGMLLAAIGCVLGVGFAIASIRELTALIPKDMLAGMPFLEGLGLNWHIAIFAAILAVLAGSLFAITPMSRVRSINMCEGLSQAGRGSDGLVWRRFGANLVMVELATAMVLLVGAGLLGKSLYRLLHVDIGIQPDHIATMRVQAQREKYANSPQQAALAREILRRASALPGVQAVGLTSQLPIEDGDGTTGFRIMGRPYHGESNEVAIRSITPRYTSVMKTTLKSGRYFRDDDDTSKPKVMIVNETLARKYFPGEDPVGRQLSLDEGKTGVLIVGVIDDIQEGQLDAAPQGAMYLSMNQNPDFGFVVVARTAQDERALLPALASTLQSIDSGMAIFEPITMADKIHDAPATYLHRSAAWLVGGFAGLALLLSVVGLYGVIAYSVSQRTREIGVRMALGAERVRVYGMVLREAGWLIIVGLIGGTVVSIAASLALQKLLFHVAAWDASTLILVSLVLAAASLAASFLPAHRAASINPVDALRSE